MYQNPGKHPAFPGNETGSNHKMAGTITSNLSVNTQQAAIARKATSNSRVNNILPQLIMMVQRQIDR